jgi:hypothetical protein
MGLFQTKDAFRQAVMDLHSLALSKEYLGDMTTLKLCPLVHYMARARLPIDYQANWAKNAAEYLCWPLF